MNVYFYIPAFISSSSVVFSFLFFSLHTNCDWGTITRAVTVEVASILQCELFWLYNKLGKLCKVQKGHLLLDKIFAFSHLHLQKIVGYSYCTINRVFSGCSSRGSVLNWFFKCISLFICVWLVHAVKGLVPICCPKGLFM